MEGQHRYFLFGEMAVRHYNDCDFPAFIRTVNAEGWTQSEMDIFHYDESLHSAEDVLQAVDGYLAWQPIAKEEYDAIHNYMHPPVEMFEQILPRSAKDILFEALCIADANLNNLLKLGVEVDTDQLEYMRHDITGLKGMMDKNYELKITMTKKEMNTFVSRHYVDFPEYTTE